MRAITALLVVAVTFVTGCQYHAPLTDDHSIAIDPALIGLWEQIPDDGKEPSPDTRMLILRYSETEYLVHYPMGKESLYYRAYPIKLGDVACVQIQVIGNAEGPVSKDDNECFHVVHCSVNANVLTMKTLNTDLVDKALKTSDELRKAFLEKQDNPNLFTSPGQFRKVTPGNA